VCFVLKWSSTRHSSNVFCHEMVKPQTMLQSVLSWNGQAPDIVALGFDHFTTKQTDTMSGAWPFHDKTDWYYVWGLNISWQNWLTLWLGLYHFMTKPIDTISRAWPLHDKANWYYVWGVTFSWQNRLILCLGLDHFITNRPILCLGFDHFMTKHTATRHSISLFCHEKVTPQT
jgi:hypothetical protein